MLFSYALLFYVLFNTSVIVIAAPPPLTPTQKISKQEDAVNRIDVRMKDAYDSEGDYTMPDAPPLGTKKKTQKAQKQSKARNDSETDTDIKGEKQTKVNKKNPDKPKDSKKKDPPADIVMKDAPSITGENLQTKKKNTQSPKKSPGDKAPKEGKGKKKED